MMNKEQVLEKLGEFDVKDLNMVMELLDQKKSDEEKGKIVKWEEIFKPFNTTVNQPKYMYCEVWTQTNGLSKMITDAILEAEEKGYRWYDTQYTMGNNQGVLIHSALLIFKKD